MKAEQILRSNVIPAVSNHESKNDSAHGKFNPDTFYARLRRLEARLSELENALTAIRRDVNRIDRKQYRDAQSSTIQPVVSSSIEELSYS